MLEPHHADGLLFGRSKGLLCQLHRDARRRLFHRRTDELPRRIASKSVPNYSHRQSAGERVSSAAPARLQRAQTKMEGAGLTAPECCPACQIVGNIWAPRHELLWVVRRQQSATRRSYERAAREVRDSKGGFECAGSLTFRRQKQFSMRRAGHLRTVHFISNPHEYAQVWQAH